MRRTTTLKMGSLAPPGQMRSEHSDPEPVYDPSLDELVRTVNEVAESVRDTLNLIFFDIG
jgi:hypothetical protein